MKKNTHLVKICTFLLTIASVMVVNTNSPAWIGEPKLPKKI